MLAGDAGAHPIAAAAIAGKQTVNTMFGTRVAVLAGDFLFAQASWLIANLENLEVCAQLCNLLLGPERLGLQQQVAGCLACSSSCFVGVVPTANGTRWSVLAAPSLNV